MSEAYCIPPFPSDADRDAFGHWLSGFADGEASFNLYAVTDASDGRRESLRACFRLALRADDGPVIRQARSFWSCGTLQFTSNVRCKIPNAKPVLSLNVTKIADLVSVLVPHFERYPLRSKKRRDFILWKQGVSMIWTVSQRPHPCKGINWQYHGGTSKWTDRERQEFKALVQQLKSSRAYDAPKLNAPAQRTTPPASPGLFENT